MTQNTPPSPSKRWKMWAAGAALALFAGFSAAPSIVNNFVTPTTVQASGGQDYYDAATKDDAAFNAQFKHAFAQVNDVKMHYVVGGSGPPMVLLHGWPQTWYEWRTVLPALAKHYTVYAVDLPGLGDSEGTPRGMDKKTLAVYVHGLIEDKLDLGPINLVAHDLGAGVGFQLAAQFPDAVRNYVHMDYPLPSTAALPAEQYRNFSWHMSFNSQPALPEEVVDSPEDVRQYLQAFYPQVAFGGTAFGGKGAESPFTTRQVQEFTRTYSRPDVLRNGFNLYRTLSQDQLDNDAAGPVAVRTKVITATGSLASTMPTLTPLFSNLQDAVEIPKAGHWLPEESPDAVTKEILAFTSW